MAIDAKTRKKLMELFTDVDYRKIVADRAGCHPNTVSNVLNGNDNAAVELELAKLAQEVKSRKQQEQAMRKQSRDIIKQL
jgi:DNA-binding LacI/PurR family transcriptional regulator